ncbi:glycosyltransferase [Pontiellaceae bacterium B12219]|nr:glycosyltransferase [Pontiellaceae bacterium B12219]
MKFWIVTPSYNQVDWLKRAVASVADQAMEGLEVHHHVQDGASTDGTVEWLKEYAAGNFSAGCPGYSFSYESAPDQGMYNAINMGWDKTPVEYDFIAYINCDEQYLPGGLMSIARAFQKRKDADIILATNIVVDGDGNYLCHRRAVKPYLWSARLWTASSACSTFMRRTVYFENGGGFDTRWSIVGDMVWYVNLLEKKLNIRVSSALTSVFFDDGNNLATTSRGVEELKVYRKQCLGWTARFSGFARQFNTFRRILADIRIEKPRKYAIYRSDSGREVLTIDKPTNLWKR